MQGGPHHGLLLPLELVEKSSPQATCTSVLRAACCLSFFNEESGAFLPDGSIKNLMQSLRTLGLPFCLLNVLDPRFLEFL